MASRGECFCGGFARGTPPPPRSSDGRAGAALVGCSCDVDRGGATTVTFAESQSECTVRPMPLHYVDPHKKQSRWYTAIETWGRSRPGQFMARHITPRVDPWLYRATGGRYPSVLGGVSTAPLITTGAKSGQPREHQLTYFHDGDDAIVIASNYGGPKHPQWYFNLTANPECEFG
jgi:hypothetical protein